MDLCNLSVIRELMSDAGITFRKEFGQNFLTNRIIPEDIADNCTDNQDSMILEIGPGIGCLTQELAIRYKKVVAVEIDKGLIPILGRTMSEYDNVTVINDDIMKVDLQALIDEYSEGMPVAVCANLPYYITTPILMRLLESGVKFTSITIMIQNEVAARLVAKPGSSDYGAIAVVRIDLYREPKYTPKNEKLFRDLIRAAFEMRRKTLQNAVCAKLPYSKDVVLEAIRSIGHPDTVRGERLSTEDFVKLADALS